MENLFSGIPKDEQQGFFQLASLHFYKKGDVFQPAGETCKKIGIVNSGILKSVLIDDEGNQKVVEFYTQNDIVSAFTSFITQKVSTWNIVVLEDANILVLSKEALESLYEKNPLWLTFGLKIFELQTVKKCMREKSLLMNTATERYNIFRKQYANIEDRLPLNQIALYLGIQPESLSRIRKKMRLNIDQ